MPPLHHKLRDEDAGQNGGNPPAGCMRVLERQLADDEGESQSGREPLRAAPRLRRLEPILPWRRPEFVGGRVLRSIHHGQRVRSDGGGA